MRVTAEGFRWDVALVLPEDVQVGQEVSLAGLHVRHALAGFPVQVDWEQERMNTVITDQPEQGDEGLWHFTDGHRMFAVSPGWPVLRWVLLG